MSVSAMSWVFDHSTSTGSDRLVLLALADRMNDYDEAWPSVERLANAARVSTRTAQRSLAHLVEIGELREVAGGAREAAARAGRQAPRPDREPRAYHLTRTPHGVTDCHPDGATDCHPVPQTGVTPLSPPNRGRGDTQRAHGVTPVSPDTKEEPKERSTQPPLYSRIDPGVRGGTLAHYLQNLDDIAEAVGVERATAVAEVERRARVLRAVPGVVAAGLCRQLALDPPPLDIIDPAKLLRARADRWAPMSIGFDPHATVDQIHQAGLRLAGLDQ